MMTRSDRRPALRRGGILIPISRRLQRARDNEEGFALVFALLLILIVTALSIGVAGLIYSQVQPTQFERKNDRTISAASAGMQVVLDKLRAANDGTGNGRIQYLPCTAGTSGASFTFGSTAGTTSGTTVSGSVGSGTGALTYQTSVAYLTVNPSAYQPGGTAGNTTYAQFLTWLKANALPCPVSTVPSYAYIQSVGLGTSAPGVSATQGNRTVHSVYMFATTATNLPGGRLIEMLSSPALCVEAPTNADVNSTVTVNSCKALGTPEQTFQYRNDLTIKYTGDPNNRNLCITKPSSGSTPTLQTCLTDGSTSVVTYPYASGQQAQEWAFNDSGHFAVPNSDGSVPNGSGGSCLEPNGATSSAQPSSVPVTLVLATCDGVTVGRTSWTPDPQVGAGKAGGNTSGAPGAPTFQYVNYYEFGRCLDVNGQQVSNPIPLIDYPCKQAPDSSKLTFNQVWSFTPVSGNNGTFSLTCPNDGSSSHSDCPDGTKFCLTAASSGTKITMQSCASTPGDNQLWKTTGNISGDYSNSFILVSKLRLMCMGLSGASPEGWSTPALETCDGSLDQKWNAVANPPSGGLTDVQEDSDAES